MSRSERGHQILEVFAEAARLGDPYRRAYIDPTAFLFFRRRGRRSTAKRERAGCFHCGRPVWRRFSKLCEAHR